MTGDNADILCGEWDSNGNNDPSTSGEKYNIALTIKEIVRHPDYIVNPSTEQSYLENDIAVFKVQGFFKPPIFDRELRSRSMEYDFVVGYLVVVG